MAESSNGLGLRKVGTVERFLESPFRRAIISSVFAGAICLFLACCINTGNTDDDWTLSLYLSGRLDGQSLSLFVNAFFSKIIFLLNTLMPNISWFFAAEHLTTLLALAVFTYGVLTWWRCGSGYAVLALIMVYVMPSCIAASNYTVVAFFATAVGGMLLIRRMQDSSTGAPTAIVGVALVLLGLALRFQMFILGAPFLFVAFIRTLSLCASRYAGTFNVKKMIPIVVSFILCCLMLVYDHVVWQQDGWKQWREYNEPRTIISDYPMPNYQDVKEQLTEIGVSENDYFMLINWASADVDALNTETIAKVAELQIKPNLSLSEIASTIVAYVQKIATRPLFFGLMLVTFALLLIDSGETKIVTLLELSITIIVCLYFFALGRLPDRVEEPTWLYACIASLSCIMPAQTQIRAQVASRRFYISLITGCAMLIAGSCYVIHQNRPFLNLQGLAVSLTQANLKAMGTVSSYVEKHPDFTYIVDSGTYTRFELEYGYRYLPSSDTATRIIPLGGWGSGSPFRKEQCQRLGATNPFEALLADDARLITTPSMAERVLKFLQEHYNPGVRMKQIDTIMPNDTDTPVWELSLPTKTQSAN